MAEIRFYHLERQELEQVLPVLIGKALEKGHRIFVKVGSDSAGEQLSTHLWTYKPDVFLPHGTVKDGQAERQPVWLGQGDESPNEADVLILTQGGDCPNLDKYALICDMLDGRDGEAVSAARARWTAYKEAGHEVTYWQQGPQGGWEKKAG